jgi:hypothetical protein
MRLSLTHFFALFCLFGTNQSVNANNNTALLFFISIIEADFVDYGFYGDTRLEGYSDKNILVPEAGGRFYIL